MKTAAKKRNSRASGVIALMLVLASALVFASSATASSASHVGPNTRAEVSERFTLKSIESIATSAANATRYYDCLGEVALECIVAPSNGPGRIYSSRTTSEIADVASKPTSVKQLQQKLGRSGLIDSSKVRIVRAADSELPDVPGMTFYGWVSQTGAGLLKDHKGRFIIKITDDGLSSLKTAVSTIGHELHHIREALAGAGASEAAANAAGEEMLKRFLKWMAR